MVLITRCKTPEADPDLVREIRRHHPSVRILHSGHRPVGWIDAEGARTEAPERAVAFCGIGSPEIFRRDLLGQGVQLEGFHAFGDHHRYEHGEWERLLGEARSAGVPLVTTEKDLARLAERAKGQRLLALRIEALPLEPDALLDAVMEKLG